MAYLTSDISRHLAPSKEAEKFSGGEHDLGRNIALALSAGWQANRNRLRTNPVVQHRTVRLAGEERSRRVLPAAVGGVGPRRRTAARLPTRHDGGDDRAGGKGERLRQSGVRRSDTGGSLPAPPRFVNPSRSAPLPPRASR